MNYLQPLFPIRNNNFNREPAPKANVSGLTLKERGIVIFAWYVLEVSFGVKGLVFAPRQKRTLWG